ncbi:MAG: translocation/assembly module TamB domain-containing protein [Pseudomonadota bacterium]
MMKSVFIKLSRYTGRFAAALISVAFVIVLFVMMGLQGFAIWLTTTDKGSDWLSARLTGLAENTPYEVTLGDFELQGLFGVRAKSMSLADQQGVFLEAQKIGIDIDILPLALRRAVVNLNAELIDLKRLPQGRAEEQTEPDGKAFALPARPDLYFNRIVLNSNIEQLTLGAEVPGGPVTTPLKMAQDIRLDDEAVTLAGHISLAAQSAALPDDFDYQISAPWQTGIISVEAFTAKKADQYDIRGLGGWESANGAFDVQVTGAVEKEFHPRLERRGDIDLNIFGTTDDYSGAVSVRGAFMGEDFTVETPLSGSDSAIALSAIKGQGYGFTLDGNVIYGFGEDTGIKGEIKAEMSSLDLVEGLSGLEGLAGQGQVSLAFDDGSYSGTGHFTDIAYQDRKLDQLNFTLTPEQDRHFMLDLEMQGPEQEPFAFNASARVDPEARNLEVEEAVLNLDSGQATMTGEATPEMLDLEIEASDLALAQLPYLNMKRKLVITDGQLDIQGSPAAPEMEGRAQLTGAAIEQQEATIALTGSYRENKANIMATAEGRGIETLVIRADLPVQIALYPFEFSVDRTAELSGTAKGDFNLGAVLSPFLNDLQTVRGDVALDAAITGSLATPSLNGDITLAEGRFQNKLNNLFLDDINGTARLQGSTVVIDSLTASDGRKGEITSEGRIDFSTGLRPDLEVSITADDMRLLQKSEHKVEIDADLLIESVDDRYLVSGIIMPEEILITLPGRFNTTIPELNIVEKGAETQPPLLEILKLDVAIRADKRVFIRGWGLDAELGGRLNLEGTAATPELHGTLSAIRGRYEELGKVFEISRANLRFQGTVPPSPYLDIMVETEAGDIQAQILMTGPAQEPNLSFVSVPSLPEDEILAHVLFGRDTSTISPFQAVQLASTIRRFSGQGEGMDPLGALRDLTGLDNLRIEGGGDNVTVGAGKYLTDKVYFQLQQGGTDNASAAVVEVEVTPHVTLESKAGSSGNSGAGVFWEWDY